MNRSTPITLTLFLCDDDGRESRAIRDGARWYSFTVHRARMRIEKNRTPFSLIPDLSRKISTRTIVKIDGLATWTTRSLSHCGIIHCGTIMSRSPLPFSLPSQSNSSQMQTNYEEAWLSNDECTYKIVTSDMLSSTQPSRKPKEPSTNVTSDNSTTVNRTYGPLQIRVQKATALTLATGRRSKFVKLEGEAAIKREKRRQKNRESARRLKETRTRVQQDLEQEIDRLEVIGQNLLTEIDSLRTHKDNLEKQLDTKDSIRARCIERTLLSTALSSEVDPQQVQEHMASVQEHPPIKIEPQSPSPPWQLSFQI